MIKKIVVIGPESTGKSTLCEKLAAHYNTLWVPEYAREYLEKHGTDYTYEDLLPIAKGQIELEEEITNQQAVHSPLTTHHSPLFIDTDMYVMKVWAEYVFNNSLARFPWQRQPPRLDCICVGTSPSIESMQGHPAAIRAASKEDR